MSGKCKTCRWKRFQAFDPCNWCKELYKASDKSYYEKEILVDTKQ